MELNNISEIAFHRNGVCGEPFKVCTFEMNEHGETRRMVAIRFNDDQPQGNPRIAVLDLNLLAQGEIRFTRNSWRGDHFVDELDLHFYQKEAD